MASFRAVCPESELLVIDNGSPQRSIGRELAERAVSDEHLEVVRRDAGRPVHPKVGTLHDAYCYAFDVARRRGFDYVHLLQGDLQVMWWDEDARHMLAELFGRHPHCVNIHMLALSKDRWLMGDVVVDGASGDPVIPRYGMTDTGVFHLRRWDALDLRFWGSEEETSSRALARGLEVVASPWPTEVPVPWPAVVRRGRQVGREIRTEKPFLCRPLDERSVTAVKSSPRPVAWEDICVPWGWSCLSPMSATDLTRWYYLNYRLHDLRRNGWRRGAPRWVTAGLDRRADLLLAPRRPPLLSLLLRPVPSLLAEIFRRVRRRPEPSRSR
ncbi:MAG: hypothetical protein ACRDY3_06655 [Acidimicrobiales bacterium]